MKMKMKIDEEFKNICRKILNMNLSINEWEKIESDDMFQTQHYEGGYDATENAFCFSFYDENKTEYWIQISLEEVKKILSNSIDYLEARIPD